MIVMRSHLRISVLVLIESNVSLGEIERRLRVYGKTIFARKLRLMTFETEGGSNHYIARRFC